VFGQAQGACSVLAAFGRRARGLTRVATSSLSHLFSARGAPLREPSGQRPRQSVANLASSGERLPLRNNNPTATSTPQSPRAHSRGRPPKENYHVPNKHVANLKLHNRLPINHRRTSEADIDSTNCHQGSKARTRSRHSRSTPGGPTESIRNYSAPGLCSLLGDRITMFTPCSTT
jgi:hypothetical protein